MDLDIAMGNIRPSKQGNNISVTFYLESSILVVSRQKSDALEISRITDKVMSFLNFFERFKYLFSKTLSPLTVSHIDSVLPYFC